MGEPENSFISDDMGLISISREGGIIMHYLKRVKHEWPVQLTSFITSLVGAAKARESICKEAVAILKVRILKRNLIL